MSEVDLTTLNRRELRRLLDVARERGQAEVSYQILQEMAARREGEGRRGLLPAKRSAKPRVVALDLGDPLEPQDDLPPAPHWVAPPREPEPAGDVEAASPPEPPPPRPRRKPQAPPAAPPPVAETVEAEPALPMAEAETVEAEPAPPMAEVVVEPSPAAEPPDPEPPPAVAPVDPEPAPVLETPPVRPRDPAPPADRPTDSLHLDLRQPDRPARGQRRGGAVAIAFAAGIGLGVAVGWGASELTRPKPASPAAPEPSLYAEAPLSSPTLPAAPPPAAPEPQSEPDPGPLAAEFKPVPEGPSGGGAAESAPPMAEGPRIVSAEPLDLPPPAAHPAEAAEPSQPAAPAEARSCAAEPTPADRTICADPQLRRLQRELQQAYAEALEAHEERDLLRQRQLAWRAERDKVSDPDRLAEIYEDRIRKLNSATAQALGRR